MAAMFKIFAFLAVVLAASALTLPKSHIGEFKGRIGDDPPPDPEEYLTTPELLAYFGYPCETHTITTEDGYIIQFFRVPYGLNTTATGPKTPVLVQHGILCSSSDWVINFPYQSLGFYLADLGYDVWLTNVRGNVYGRNHTTLNPDKDNDFWHFSWDQMAQYEIPQQLDYILQATGYEQLYYVGHSMGTTVALSLLSTQTEYNAKIKKFVAMGPVATLNHVVSPIKYLAPFANLFDFIIEAIGTGEFLPSDGVIAWFAQDCTADLAVFCDNILFVLCGYDEAELNSTRMDVYLTHTPAGTSTMTMVHYAQEIDVGRFRHCNWGDSENMERYGQITPPDYDVGLVTAPTVLFWGANDWIADPEDVNVLQYSLPNLVGSYQTGGDSWAHMDFLWGIDTGTLVNPQAVEQMPKF